MSEPIEDPSADRRDRELFQGAAAGGPLDGQDLTSRFAKGVVAVDKAGGKAWIYDYHAPGESVDARFTVRDSDGMSLDDEKRWAAAEGADYDVVAVG